MGPEGGADAETFSLERNPDVEPANVGGSGEALAILPLETLPARAAIGSGGFFVSAR